MRVRFILVRHRVSPHANTSRLGGGLKTRWRAKVSLPSARNRSGGKIQVQEPLDRPAPSHAQRLPATTFDEIPPPGSKDVWAAISAIGAAFQIEILTGPKPRACCRLHTFVAFSAADSRAILGFGHGVGFPTVCQCLRAGRHHVKI